MRRPGSGSTFKSLVTLVPSIMGERAPRVLRERLGLSSFQIPKGALAGLPSWWLIGIAASRFDCRYYGVGDEVWTFDMSLVRSSDWTKAVDDQALLGPFTLFHHVDPGVVRRRMIDLFTGSGGEAPGGRAMVEGRAHTPTVFAYNIGNDLEVWDPVLSFPMHAVIRDGNEWWQWQVGRLVIDSSKAYFRNAELDLAPYEAKVEELFALRNSYYARGHKATADQRHAISVTYTDVLKLHRQLADEVFQLHKKWKATWLNANPFEADLSNTPLELLPVQTYEVRSDGAFDVRTYMEIVYWAAALGALKDARDSSDPMVRLRKRAEAVQMGVASGETLMNRVAETRLAPAQFKKWDGLSAIKRWEELGTFASGTAYFAPGDQILADIQAVISLRNRLVHYRPTTKTVGGGHVEILTEADVIGALKAIRAGSEVVAQKSGYGLAPWLRSSVGWDFPSLDSF